MRIPGIYGDLSQWIVRHPAAAMFVAVAYGYALGQVLSPAALIRSAVLFGSARFRSGRNKAGDDVEQISAMIAEGGGQFR